MAGCICEQCVSGLHRVSHVCIGSSWIFRDLEPEEKTALASAAIRRLFKRGDVIFSQDEVADRMFLIKAGRIKISKVTEDGNELILDIRKEGDFLGEQIFWDDFRYPGTAACIEDTYICGFNRQSFEKLVMENPGIGLSVIKNLSKHIEFLNSRDGFLLIRDLQEKLYAFLLNLGQEHGKCKNNFFEIRFPLSHEELGFLLGVHRVSITRTMKLLRKTGLIRKEGKTLFICKN